MSEASDLARLVSYWDGPLSWLERLCAASMKAAGHRLIVYSHDPDAVRAAGLDAEIRDGREVLGESHHANRYREAGAFHHFADVFRLELLRQGKGVWVDLDCLLLQPLMTGDGYLFGRINESLLNNAVLMLPQGSALLDDYFAGITAVPFRMPWSTPQRRIKRTFEILTGQPLPAPTARTNIGPRALTYYAKRANKFDRAKAPDVFYPVLSQEAGFLVRADDRAAHALITENSQVVHTWHGNLRDLEALATLPPASSYLGQACARFGMT